MKHTLAMAISMFTLLSWSAMGAYNPQITEVNLSIDGVADADEFSPGPGGFVAKDGWKKITLSYTVENPPTKTRLNWNSDKIKVFTATNNGTEIANGILWEPASDMPSTLYVNGVAVSESGPIAASGSTPGTCGPEHMCIEAINNGTAYTTPLYDRIGFTVFDLNVRTKKKDASDWDSDSTSTEIAAGGLDTAVHQADVEVELVPAGIVSSSRPLTICLTTNSGGGYLPPTAQQWWWPADVHKRALLTVGSSTYEYSEVSGSPITLTSLTGSIAGTLRSSNKIEPTTVRAEFAGYGIEREVSFAAGDFVLQVPANVEPYVWKNMTITRTFGTTALAEHRVKIFAREVEETDGTVIKARYGSSLSTSYALESYVWIGSHPSEDYNTGQGVFDEVTVGSDGQALSQYNVRGFQTRVELQAVDLNSAQYYDSMPTGF